MLSYVKLCYVLLCCAVLCCVVFYIEDITRFPKDMDFIFEWQKYLTRRTSFYDFLKFSENLRKSSKVFGNIRKFSENLRKWFKSNFQMFL